MSKKILLFITQLEAAGAQKAIAVLAQGLIKSGFEVKLYCFYDKTNARGEFQHKYGIDFISLNDGNSLSKLQLLRAVVKLWFIIRKEKFDIVQTFTHYSNIIVPPVAKLATRCKVITSQRGRVPPLGRGVSQLDALIQNSFFVDKMVCVSKGIFFSCVNEQKIKANKLIVIENGIDPKQKCRMDKPGFLDTDKFIFTTVARLHPQKDHTTLIEAISHIDSEVKDAEFIFVGDGELKDEIANKIGSLNLSHKIKCVGKRNDVDDILSHSDAFILPSLWEGMPNCVLEAMKYKLPVIATNIEGSCDLVIEGKTGYLVEPGQPNALAEKIKRVYGESNKRLGQAGYEHLINNFTLENYQQRFIHLYRSVL